MGIENIGTMLRAKEYDFLRENKNLGNNIILLGFRGSHAYGTNNENLDKTKRSILTDSDFERVVAVDTDTTVYSIDKIVKLLCSCNPKSVFV